MKNIIDYRRKLRGFFEVSTKIPIRDSYSLSLVYTPGVGKSSLEIKDNPDKSFELTNRGNSIAVITDCSNFKDIETINPLCGIPVVESKAVFYKEFAGIDAYPVVVNTTDIHEIGSVISNLTPSFAGFDLDDFSPERSAVLEKLLLDLKFPVLYGYRKPKIFFTVEQLDLLDRINPAIILPAMFRAVLDVQATEINDEMFQSVEYALKDLMNSGLKCSAESFNPEVAAKIAYYTAKAALETGVAKLKVTPEFVEDKYLDYFYEGQKSWFEKPLPNYQSTDHTLEENSLELHRRTHGVIETASKIQIRNSNDYEKFCSADAAEWATREIELDYTKAYDLTPKGNLVAIISDGSAVLGFGNIGAEAAIPVMEGKAALFKSLAGVDAVPLCLKTQDPDELIKIISHITPMFGGINLEDISSPRCFEIENKLIETLNIPVFHDDQHGTAVVVLAGAINALKLTQKKFENVKIVINGAGAAALSVTELLLQYGIENIILCDTKGAIYKGRTEGMNYYKEAISHKTNPHVEKGDLSKVIRGADIFIGLSKGGVLSVEMIKSMANQPVIFALANPTPEIMPDLAYSAGAFIVATGRSDFKNQLNNSLAFPGIFRGTLDVRAKRINNEMKTGAAHAIAGLIKNSELKPDCIIPHALDLSVSATVARAVAKAAIETNVAQLIEDPEIIFERTRDCLYIN